MAESANFLAVKWQTSSPLHVCEKSDCVWRSFRATGCCRLAMKAGVTDEAPKVVGWLPEEEAQ
eukprot:CAMPEP_0173348630 /NCGR_PEP_ID=MMETSP1144-20121109/13844_1 /TAXON_ID=483371 /ORGANISM="non described non described, Strain CCMP2298" /LENGTH=62 /DNA_ID=CAMNT_0014296305 /DNA_START=487 /DNA_END=675 /DNA_ORIENTATION=-